MKKYLLALFICLLSGIAFVGCSDDNEGDDNITSGLDINGTKYKAVCDVAEFASYGYFYFSINFPESSIDDIVPPLSFSGYFLELYLEELNVGDDLLVNHKTSNSNKFGVLDYHAEGEFVNDECIAGHVLLLEKNLPNIKLKFDNITFMINGEKYTINGECEMNLKKK